MFLNENPPCKEEVSVPTLKAGAAIDTDKRRIWFRDPHKPRSNCRNYAIPATFELAKLEHGKKITRKQKKLTDL